VLIIGEQSLPLCPIVISRVQIDFKLLFAHLRCEGFHIKDLTSNRLE